MIETLQPVMGVMLFAWILITYPTLCISAWRFLRKLKNDHGAIFDNLGRPTIFSNSIWDGLPTVMYLQKRDYLEGSKELIALCESYRLWIVLSFWGSILIVGALIALCLIAFVIDLLIG